MTFTEWKPSDVVLEGVPLTGTLGKSEMEAAAALMVRAMQKSTDHWRFITMPELGVRLQADVEAREEPWCRLAINPFWNPILGLALLSETDFIEFDGPKPKAGDPAPAFRFTEKGIRAMARWVRKP